MALVAGSAVYAAVLASALAHAGWNAILKGSTDRFLMLSSIRVVGLCAGIAVALFVPLPAAASLPYLAGAAALHYAYFALMINAYRVGDMNQVYPIARGVAPLLVVLLGALLAGHALDALTTLAVCVLSAGIVSLAFSGKTFNKPAVLFALATGVTIAGYSFIGGIGIRKAGSLLGFIAWLEISTGIGMAGLCLGRRQAELVAFARSRWRAALGAGLMAVAGYAVALVAMSMAPIAAVVALRETSVVFAAVIGSVFLREGFGAGRIAAALAVCAGVVLLGIAGL